MAREVLSLMKLKKYFSPVTKKKLSSESFKQRKLWSPTAKKMEKNDKLSAEIFSVLLMVVEKH